MSELPPLSPASLNPQGETAQRFLGAAWDSVESMLEWYESAADLAKDDAADSPELGEWTSYSAENMLRASLVFAGAGLDSAVKQLVRDALPYLLESSELSKEKFLAFTERRLNTPDASHSLARWLISANPRQALVDDYVQHLTGSSLQSVKQVEVAATALGIIEPDLRRRMRDLAPVFLARNEITHELDLLDPQRHGDRNRRARRLEDIVAMSHSALSVGQNMINAVSDLLR